jgi:hypothetical protein
MVVFSTAVALLAVSLAAPAVMLEEYAVGGVLRHHIPVPDRPSVVTGHASRALTPSEAEMILADVARGRTPDYSPRRSIEAVVFKVEYEMLREASGWVAKVSSMRVVFSHRAARAKGVGGVPQVHEEHESLRGRRTFLIPDSAPGWRKGAYRGAPGAAFSGTLCHKLVGVPPRGTPDGKLPAGSVQTILDPGERIEVLFAPEKIDGVVFSFWNREPMSALVEEARARNLAIVVASPKTDGWADVMWTFRCARHYLAGKLGAAVPVFVSGAGQGALASVNAADWYPDEVTGVVADGISDLMDPAADDAFLARVEMPIAYVCGAGEPAFEAVRRAYAAAQNLGRPSALLQHPASRGPAPAGLYADALEWLLSQPKRR